MATERGVEEKPTRRPQQWHSPKCREDGWQKSRECSQEGKRDHKSQFIKYEHGSRLRGVQLIRERWIRWFHTLLNTKSPKLDPNIAEGLEQWPENTTMGNRPTMQKLTHAIRFLANEKTVGPDGVLVELFKIALNCDPALRQRLLDIAVCIWRGGGHNSGKTPSSRCSTKTRIGQSAAPTGVSRW